MFCNALMFAPARIAKLAAVCRNSWSLKSAGSPASTPEHPARAEAD